VFTRDESLINAESHYGDVLDAENTLFARNTRFKSQIAFIVSIPTSSMLMIITKLSLPPLSYNSASNAQQTSHLAPSPCDTP